MKIAPAAIGIFRARIFDRGPTLLPAEDSRVADKDQDLARASPLLRAHVIPHGSYDLSIR